MPLLYIKRLTYEERATWGTCPVCGATAGITCTSEPNAAVCIEFESLGTHAARMINAPLIQVVPIEEETDASL
jgi:hypothetical protein